MKTIRIYLRSNSPRTIERTADSFIVDHANGDLTVTGLDRSKDIKTFDVVAAQHWTRVETIEASEAAETKIDADTAEDMLKAARNLRACADFIEKFHFTSRGEC